MNKIIFLLLFVAQFQVLSATNVLKYLITNDGDTVGHLTVKKHQVGDTMVYEYYSVATVKFFGSHHVVSTKLCKYVKGKMVLSISTQYDNNELRDSVTLRWRGSYYDVYETGTNKQQTDLVKWSTINMFFGEPIGQSRVFAEKSLEFEELTSSAKGHYQADGGWGKKNQYYYNTSGQLVRAEFNNPLIDFELHLVSK